MPRRVSRKPKASHTSARPRTREPLAEGIRKRRPKGFLSKMSDDGLVAFAKRFMKKNEISGRTELKKADGGLYWALGKRKLLDEVGLEEKQRDWASMSEDELVVYAKRFAEEKRIKGREELRKADSGLYDVLRRRKLLDKVGFERKKRKEMPWKRMANEELVDYTEKFMKEEGISKRGELAKMDGGLYHALRKRKLLDMIGFEDRTGKRRPNGFFTKMNDKELVSYTKKLMEENRIKGRHELEKADYGLYQALRTRKLLDRVGFEEKYRDWASMSDKELVDYTEKFMKKKGINGRTELSKADKGLYTTLGKRKLLDKVGFEEKRRGWASMSDDELVDYTEKFMKKKGINGRGELWKADRGLYHALRRRNLLNKVRFEEKLRGWASMSDDELVAFAKAFVKEKGINKRWDLGKRNKGLYSVLRRRKLLDRVFAPIEKAKQRYGDDEVIRVLEEFGG